MDEPAPQGPSRAAIHEHLLKTAQNLSADRRITEQRLDQARHALSPLHASEERDLQRRIVGLTHLRDIVVGQAAEVGVPAAAVDTAVRRGEQGKRWQRNQPRPRESAADRRNLLSGLLGHVRRFTNMAAVHRAYELRFGEPSATAGLYHRAALEALHERIGAVAYALRLTPGEQEFVWGHSKYIVATMTTQYLDGAESDLVARWDSGANGANWLRESQLGEPLRAAGITREAIAAAGQLPPTPGELITALDPAMSMRGNDAAAAELGGSAISSAIEAADLSTDGNDPGPLEPDAATDPDPTPSGLDP
ncbi:hypothetical protein ACWDYH_31265 [Nocardia goodfellowii]